MCTRCGKETFPMDTFTLKVERFIPKDKLEGLKKSSLGVQVLEMNGKEVCNNCQQNIEQAVNDLFWTRLEDAESFLGYFNPITGEALSKEEHFIRFEKED